jgi:hypothetical protein
MISDVINRDNQEEEGGNGEELRRTENGKRGKLDWGIKDKFVTKYLLPSLTVLSLAYNIGGLLDYIHSESVYVLIGLVHSCTWATGRRHGVHLLFNLVSRSGCRQGRDTGLVRFHVELPQWCVPSAPVPRLLTLAVVRPPGPHGSQSQISSR